MKVVDAANGWLPIRTAPEKELVYVGTEKAMVLAYKDERGQWRRAAKDGAPLNWQVWQWKPRSAG